MNLKHTSVCTGVIAGSILIFSHAPTHAASFTAQDAVSAGCVTKTTCNVDGFTLTATKNGIADPEITQKTVGGVLGLGIAANASPAGVNNDQSQGEIDIDEALSVGFASVQKLTSLDLSFLYRPGVYYDQVYEMATATPLGSSLKGLLTITGEKTATWTFNGITSDAVNLSPSSEGSGGSYRILNPFGDLTTAGLSLIPQLNTIRGTSKIPGGYANSDFALSRVETASVAAIPESSAAAVLLSFGAMIPLGLRRRRRANVS